MLLCWMLYGTTYKTNFLLILWRPTIRIETVLTGLYYIVKSTHILIFVLTRSFPPFWSSVFFVTDFFLVGFFQICLRLDGTSSTSYSKSWMLNLYVEGKEVHNKRFRHLYLSFCPLDEDHRHDYDIHPTVRR